MDVARADTPEPLLSETLGIDERTKEWMFDFLDLDTSTHLSRIPQVASHAINLMVLFPEKRQKIIAKINENQLATFFQSPSLAASAVSEDLRLHVASHLAILFPKTARRLESDFLTRYEATWNKQTDFWPGVPLSQNIQRQQEMRTAVEVVRNQPRRPEITRHVLQKIPHLVTTGDWYEFLRCAAEATRFDPELRQCFLAEFENHEPEIIEGLRQRKKFLHHGPDDNIYNYTRMVVGYAVLKAEALKVSELGEITLLFNRRAGQEVPLPVRSET